VVPGAPTNGSPFVIHVRTR